LDCATYFYVRFKNTFVVDTDSVKARLINDTDNMQCTPTTNETSEPADDERQMRVHHLSEKTGLTNLLANIRQEKEQQLESQPSSSTAYSTLSHIL